MPAPQPDLNALVQLIQQLIAAASAAQPTPSPAPAPLPNQPTAPATIDQLIAILKALQPAQAGAGGTTDSGLGQVNGALGQSIGQLLNGKKSAIGILGALVTSLLGAVSSAGGLPAALQPLAAAGLGNYAMPIFLALTAWGILGKLEKWDQPTPSPPPKS